VGLSEFARRSKHAARRFAICPKYSPDLDPIEMPFSKLKAGLRKAAERTISRLRRRIGRFAGTLTARDASNYFRARRLCVKSTGICSRLIVVVPVRPLNPSTVS
jgi:hypothetical protein